MKIKNKIKLCGAYGELFSQIHGDSVIRGRFLEGNEINKIIEAGNILLEDLAARAIVDYIDHDAYNQHRQEFISNFVAPQDIQGDLVAKLCELLKNENFTVFQFGISQHAIIIELENTSEFFNISVYNTGLGLEHHIAKTQDGAVRRHACKRHRINLSQSLNKEQSIKEILTLLFGKINSDNNNHSNVQLLTQNIDALYLMMESIVIDYKGSQIDSNDSTPIKGQRSGTCTWKSYQRYMREKLLQKTPNKDFDLLLKYDIKIRSLINALEVMQHPEKIIVSAELLYVLNFASENILRLAKKLFGKKLITEKNLQFVIDLSGQSLDVKEKLSIHVVSEQPYEIEKLNSEPMNPIYIEIPSADLLQYSVNSYEYYQHNFAIDSIANCMQTINDFVSSEKNVLSNHSGLVLAMDYLCPNLPVLFNQGNQVSAADATKILDNLLTLVCKYYDYSFEEKNLGYSERRKINLLFVSVLSLYYAKMLLDKQKYSFNLACVLLSFANVMYQHSRFSVIDDPTLGKLNQQVMELIAKFMDDLNNNVEDDLHPYISSDQFNCIIREIYLNKGLDGLRLFVVLCKLNHKIVNFANISLEPRDLEKNVNFNYSVNLDCIIRTINGEGCPDAEAIITAINKGLRFEVSSLDCRKFSMSPSDKYILGEDSEVFRGGLTKIFKINREVSSDIAYIPKGKTISREDIEDSKLQSMFAEQSVSLLRLGEFIKENRDKLSINKYAHAIYLRLFFNHAIRRNLIYNPENVLFFINVLTSDDVLGLDHKEHLHARAMLILQLYYMASWNILEFINDCADDKVREEITHKIKSLDLLGYLDSKIAAIVQEGTDKFENQLATLLSLKLLHYKIKFGASESFNKEDLLEFLKTSIELSAHEVKDTPVTIMAPNVVKEILEKTSNKYFNEIKNDLASFVLNNIGYARHKVISAEYSSADYKFNIVLEGFNCQFCLVTNVATLGDKNLVKIHKNFTQNQTVQKCFSKEARFCYALSPNHIRLDFKGREFDAFYNGDQLVIHLEKSYQLYHAQEKQANYFFDKIRKSTLLDCNHEIYFHMNHKDAIIVDKITKETVYEINQDFEVIRTKDRAKLLPNHNAYVIDQIKRFEHQMFVAIWQLVDNQLFDYEINLARYNLVIRYNSAQPDIVNINDKNYQIDNSDDLKQIFPHALFFKGKDDSIKVFLPKQHYVPRLMAEVNNIPTMMYDNFGAVTLCQSKDVYSFLIDMMNPQSVNWRNTEELVEFDFTKNKVLCNSAENYFAISYYLIGHEQFKLARECLLQGAVLYNAEHGVRASEKWLKSICIDYPKKLSYQRINADDSTSRYHTKTDSEFLYWYYYPGQKDKMENNHHIALRVLACYLFVAKNNNIQDMNLGIIDSYYSNLDNINHEYRLTIEQDYILLGALKANNIDHKTFQLRYELVKAKILNQPQLVQIDEAQSLNFANKTITIEINKDSISNNRIIFNSFFEDSSCLLANNLRMSLWSDATEMAASLLPELLRAMLLSKDDSKHMDLIKYVYYTARRMVLFPQCNSKLVHYLSLLIYDITNKFINDKQSIHVLINKILACSENSYINVTNMLLVINPEGKLTVDMPVISYQFAANSEKIVDMTAGLEYAMHKLSAPLINELAIKDEIVVQDSLSDEVATARDNEGWLDIKDAALQPFVEQYRTDFRKGQLLNFEAKKQQFNAAYEKISEEELEQKIMCLEDETKKISDLIVEKFNATSLNVYSQIARKTYEKPIFNFMEILNIFAEQNVQEYMKNSFMTFEQCDELNQIIFDYLYKLTSLQELRRGSIKTNRAYSVDEDPKLLAIILVYEALTNIRLRSKQVEYIRVLVDEKVNINAILQIPMGEGKSKVLMPITAITNANGYNLSIVVEPKSLYRTTAMDLSLSTYNAFKKLPLLIEFNRDQSECYYLSSILHKLESAIYSRTYVIMTPDTMHSLYLTRNEYAIDKIYAEKLAILNKIFDIFKERGVVMVDEIHQSLDIQTDYDYASINNKPLNKKFPALETAILEFYMLLMDVPYLDDFNLFDVILGKARKPHIDEWPALKDKIANNICNNPKSVLYELALQNPRLLKLCLLGDFGVEVSDFFNNLDAKVSKEKDIIALYQKEITELMSLTIDSAFIEEYGPDQTNFGKIASMVAMPHDCQVPVVGAEFSDPVTTMNYTIQSMMHNNSYIPKEILAIIFNDWLANYYNTKRESVLIKLFDKIKDILNVGADVDFKISSLHDVLFIDKVYKESNQNIKLKSYVLAEYVMPTMTESDYELWSKSYTFNNVFKMVNGFSGTVENPHIFHPEMNFANQDKILGADGRIIDLLITSQTKVKQAEYNADAQTALGMLIEQAANNNKKLHAIIDLGAVFKHLGSNENIAMLVADNLLKYSHFSAIKFVLYFKDNSLFALSVADKKIIYLPSTNPETIQSLLEVEPKERFTFYGQAQITGIDVQQDDNAHAIVTVGENSSMPNLLQAVKRMRKFDINGKQTIELYIGTLALEKNPSIVSWDLDAVLMFVLKNTLNVKLEKNYRAAQLLMQNAVVRRILAKGLNNVADLAAYSEILKIVSNNDLSERYINFKTSHKTQKVLIAYKEKLIRLAANANLNVAEIEAECNAIIAKYTTLCAPEVQSSLNSSDVKSLRFVTRQEQTESQEEDEKTRLEQNFASSATPKYITTSSSATSSRFDTYLQHFSHPIFKQKDGYPFKCDYLDNNIFTYQNIFSYIKYVGGVYAGSEDRRYLSLTDFYMSENSPKSLENISKNAHYIAHVKIKGMISKYLLLTEEEKSEIIAGLCGMSRNNYCRWQIPNGYEFVIYTQHNHLEYSSSGVKQELDVRILMRAQLFNADLIGLINIFENEKSKKIFEEYFAKDKDAKIAYLQHKVTNFRHDQLQYLDEILKIFQNLPEYAPGCVEKLKEYVAPLRFSNKPLEIGLIVANSFNQVKLPMPRL